MTHFSSSTTMTRMPGAYPDDEMGLALRNSIEQSRTCFEGQNVLVTGACGFLGGHLVRALHSAGANVTAIDHEITTARRAFLEASGLLSEVKLVEADCRDCRTLADIVVHGQFSHLFHLSSESGQPQKEVIDPYGTILDSTMGFVNLAEAARLLPRDKRPLVVHASTDRIYSQQEQQSVGVGVAAMQCADILAGTYHQKLGVPTIVLRLCHLFGPFDLDFNGQLIPQAMRNIFRDGESPELSMNALEDFHDYIYVEDAVRAFLHLARFEQCRGGVYDLPGTHYGATPDVLRDIISQVSALQDEIALVDPRCALANHHWNRSIRIVPSKPEDEAHSTPHLDGTRLREDADFEPCTSFREALQLTAQFYAWYFSQAAPVKPRFKAITPRQERRVEPAFETVYTDDGLPVHVLNPHAHVRDKGAPREEERRPRAFVVESVLAAI
jgi:nucleoside-diphosphate-sugar epimerase